MKPDVHSTVPRAVDFPVGMVMWQWQQGLGRVSHGTGDDNDKVLRQLLSEVDPETRFEFKWLIWEAILRSTIIGVGK